MLADEHIDGLAARIDPTRAMIPQAGSLPAGGGTVYIATTDGWGNAVSLLQSNYMGFGSGLVDPSTGIAFHDRGAFFRLDPTHPNALAPRKRPTHTLAPGLLLRDGRPWIVHGSMGGEIQPQVFAQVVSALVDGGADVATAVAAPRWAAMMRAQHGPADLTAGRMPPPRRGRRGAASQGSRGQHVRGLVIGDGPRSRHRDHPRRARAGPLLRRRLRPSLRGCRGRLVNDAAYTRRQAGRATRTTFAAGPRSIPGAARREFERQSELPIQQRIGR